MQTIKALHIKRFYRIVGDLNKLMDMINKYNPEAHYYLSADEFNLMKGPSHDDTYKMSPSPIRENSVASVTINGDGGDW